MRRPKSTIPVVTIDDLEAGIWRLVRSATASASATATSSRPPLTGRELTAEVDRVITIAREWALACGAMEHFLGVRQPTDNWVPEVVIDVPKGKKLEEEEEDLMDDERRCQRCGEVRHILEFHKDPSCKSGRKATCKWCLNGEREAKRRNKMKMRVKSVPDEEIQAAIDVFQLGAEVTGL